MRVLIIPDKFKGTLTAPAAAAAIARGWGRGRPRDSLDLLPMSDGGDGFGEVMGKLHSARIQRIATVDAAHRPCHARWWWEPKTRTAIIESAEMLGLANHPGFHPYDLDTFGLGKVLQAAARKGAQRFIVGIGGTATVDGGFGLARSLGWQFLDVEGKPIDSWTHLDSLAEIQPPRKKLRLPHLTVAVDVLNPLLGSRGCARVYGPQKGLTEFTVADRCLGRLAQIAKRKLRRDCATHPGAGAAGGLGFGFLCFLGARLQPGFDLFAHAAKLKQRLRSADLVITGEGAIDRSTLMGKGVGQIALACRKLKIPCLGLAGNVQDRRQAEKLFTQVAALTDLTTLKNARKQPAHWLEQLAARAAKQWQ